MADSIRVLLLDDELTEIMLGVAFQTKHSLDLAITQGLGLSLAISATAKDFDAVILGNNLGLGLELATHLPPDLRSNTLVVWNVPPFRAQPHYERLGFRHFGVRASFSDEPDMWSFLKEIATGL